MANELVISWRADETLYAILINATGQVWNGAAFVTPADADWGDYDIPLTEVENTELYRGDMPAASAGVYTFAVRLQAGGSPAVTDDTVGAGIIHWDGSAEISLSDLDVNVTQISGDSTAADNLESACDNYSATRGLAGTALPDAAADAAGGLPISDAGGLDLDAIKSKTDNLPASPAAVGSEMALEDDAITAAKYDQSTAYPLASSDGSDLTEAGGDGDHLTAVPWNAAWDAEVQSEVQDAIEANHLDHLLATTYDPASKPGVADALLNELIENDGGVSRFTENALEQAPGGGGATPDVNVVSISGDTDAADNLEADYDGTGYAKGNSSIANVQDGVYIVGLGPIE